MTRRSLVVTLSPLALMLGLLVAVSPAPATAAPGDCPKGLPSRSAPATRKKAKAAEGNSQAAVARTTPPAKKAAGAAKAADPTPTPSPTPAAPAERSGNPIVDGWHDFLHGVGNLLGLGGGDQTPAPSASPAPPPNPATTSHPTVAPSGLGPTPQMSGGAAPEPAPSPRPTPSVPDVPCLGARVFKAAAPDSGLPKVSIRGGRLEGKSLNMYDSTYDGTVDLSTDKGTVKVLKFSMRNSVTEPFTLTIPENGGHQTVIKTARMETDTDVEFYTSRFAGKLFGVLPVEFTPTSPPPLTLPWLYFSDVSIDLAYVTCHKLTATPMLSVTEVQ